MRVGMNRRRRDGGGGDGRLARRSRRPYGLLRLLLLRSGMRLWLCVRVRVMRLLLRRRICRLGGRVGREIRHGLFPGCA